MEALRLSHVVVKLCTIQCTKNRVKVTLEKFVSFNVMFLMHA